MPNSYFRRRAEQCYRHALVFKGPAIGRTIINRLGDAFGAKADAAVARLAQMRNAVARRREVERQGEHGDRRE